MERNARRAGDALQKNIIYTHTYTCTYTQINIHWYVHILIDIAPYIPVLEDDAVVNEADVARGGGRGRAQLPNQVQNLCVLFNGLMVCLYECGRV